MGAGLRSALEAADEKRVITIISDAIEHDGVELQAALEGLLAGTLVAGARAADKQLQLQLQLQLGLRAAIGNGNNQYKHDNATQDRASALGKAISAKTWYHGTGVPSNSEIPALVPLNVKTQVKGKLSALIGNGNNQYRHDNSTVGRRYTDKQVNDNIQKYTGGTEQLNGPLRDGDSGELFTKEDREIVGVLDHAMAPTSQDTTFHRIVEQGIMPELNVGDEYTDKGFVSVAKTQEALKQVRQDFEDYSDKQAFQKLTIQAPKGTQAIDVNAHLGTDHEFARQHEVVLARGTTFKVIDKKANGDLVLEVVKQPKQLRSAADDGIDYKFDVANPAAVAWAKQHAADLVTQINATTRDRINALVEEAFADQFDVDTLASEIDEVLGGDPVRAELIARTETMAAANAGQLAAWDQAVTDGKLSGREQKVWIVTSDDRLCPVCAPLEDVTLPLDDAFDVDGDELDGPPAHPNCRCTLGLTL